MEGLKSAFERRGATDPLTGKSLRTGYDHRRSTHWMQEPRSGLRLGLTYTLGNTYLLWAEGRLGAVLERSSATQALVSPSMLPQGACAVVQLLDALGFPMPSADLATVRRCDLSSELFFDHPALGEMFLRVMALLECPRYKRDVVTAQNSNDIECIYWRTPRSFQPRQRLYDKGVESGSHRRGERIRLERQWSPPSKHQVSPAKLAARDLQTVFSGPLRPWLRSQAPLMVANPEEALHALRERQGDSVLRNGQPLSERVVERMAGTLGVLRLFGDSFYANPRTAARRRQELRSVGIVVDSSAPDGFRMQLDGALGDLVDAWNPARRDLKSVEIPFVP